MKAADMDTHPSFQLMKQSYIVSFYHLQMPRWLFTHEKYKSLSLEAKVAYTFLLNRFQLSRINGWVNKHGEVFVIFTREALAEELQISYRKSIECFKELVAASLLWEKRVGRGNANQIYLAVVDLAENDAALHNAAPFGNDGARPADTAHQEESSTRERTPTRPANFAHQEMPDLHMQSCESGSFRPADWTGQDLQNPHTSKKEKRKIDMSGKEVSQSVYAPAPAETDGQSDFTQEQILLTEILEGAELWVLPDDVVGVFESAIERLFYSEQLRIGGAVLPKANIRSHLCRLEGTILQEAYSKLKANTGQKIKNSTAYVMSVLFNCIWESQSDLLVDPYLNSLQAASSRCCSAKEVPPCY